MDATNRQAVDRNVSHIVERLQTETSPAAKDSLRRLMIAEEDRFASAVEKLELIDRWIAECDVRRAQIGKFAGLFPADSETTALTERTLNNLAALSAFLARYRGIVEAALAR